MARNPMSLMSFASAKVGCMMHAAAPAASYATISWGEASPFRRSLHDSAAAPAEASPSRAHLSLTAETATSFQQQLAWVTDTHVHLASLDPSPDKLAGGWDLIAGACKSFATSDIAARPVKSVAMAQWQLLLLEGGSAENGGTEAAESGADCHVVVVSRITGMVVQRVAMPPTITDVLCLTADPCPPAAGGADVAAGDALFVVAAGSLARLVPQQSATEVWTDFIAIGEHSAALTLIDELAEAAAFRALEDDALAGLVLHGGGERPAGELRLAAARAGVLADMARGACEAGAAQSFLLITSPLRSYAQRLGACASEIR